MITSSETHSAIDEVARRFTAGTAPATLRANVIARLGERPTPAWWREPRMVLAAALVLVVAAGAAIVQLRKPLAQPHVPVIAETAPPVTPQFSAPTPVLATSSIRAAAAPGAPATPSDAELAWRARALPALQIPAAMTFEAIQPDPLVIPLLDVTPIVMPPIALPSDGGGSR